ncbi:MAG: VCBS repeat-containing protein [Pseudanabaena sp. ELA645]|jgi:hypothetical protein
MLFVLLQLLANSGINFYPLAIKALEKNPIIVYSIALANHPKVCLPIPLETSLPEIRSSHEVKFNRSKTLGKVRVEQSFIHDYDSKYQAKDHRFEVYFRIYRNEKLIYERKSFSSWEFDSSFYLGDPNGNGEVEIVTREPYQEEKNWKPYHIFKYDKECQSYIPQRSDDYNSITQGSNFDVVQTRFFGNLTAKLIYKQRDNMNYAIHASRLQLSQWGEIILDEIFEKKGISSNGGGDVNFKVVDLDNDGDPEITIYFHTGSTMCCNHRQIYYFDYDKQKYAKYSFTNASYSDFYFEDIDGDGVWEIIKGGSVFNGVYINFLRPVLIQRFFRGKFIDATRQFPAIIRKNNENILAYFNRKRSGYNRELQALLAAYLANKYMLGEGEEGWDFVQKNYQDRDRLVFFWRLAMYLWNGGSSDD